MISQRSLKLCARRDAQCSANYDVNDIVHYISLVPIEVHLESERSLVVVMTSSAIFREIVLDCNLIRVRGA